MSVALREYQRQVMNGLFLKPGHDPLTHVVLGLTGEAGEVADLIKKSQYEGRDLDDGKLVEELGDVQWYLTHATGILGMTLESLAFSNLKKLEQRHPQLYDSHRMYAQGATGYGGHLLRR